MLLSNHTYFLVYFMRFPKGFSHVYILITCIPEMISFINRILSSVFFAVCKRNLEIIFPIQPEIQKSVLIISIYSCK